MTCQPHYKLVQLSYVAYLASLVIYVVGLGNFFVGAHDYSWRDSCLSVSVLKEQRLLHIRWTKVQCYSVTVLHVGASSRKLESPCPSDHNSNSCFATAQSNSKSVNELAI